MKLNIDTIPGLDEPLDVTLGGQDFKVASFEKAVLDAVTALGEKEDDAEGAGESVVDILAEQLTLLFHEGKSDTDEAIATFEFLCRLDARRLKAALTLILEQLTEAGKPKLRGKKRRR